MSQPSTRKLRGYAFDPLISAKLDTYEINEIIYEVPWEKLDYSGGAIKGEYLEIIDYDPTTESFYEHVNLDTNKILAEHGLKPSESDPKFHQQMVYAVAMTTIKNFEKALGRKVLWAPKKVISQGKSYRNDFVGRLRIYPHALREPNAYYSPSKKALLFGYFHANPIDQKEQMPGSLVFTCLSHDIIAHEVTHAILDGIHRNYNHPTNQDVLAFHEAFADIVALFQHFTFPEVLKHQITRTRGDLQQQNLLGQLAQEFGVAIGNYNSLRSALGSVGKDGVWRASKPDPLALSRTNEPHARGSILVASVFDAFLAIYRRRAADLYRIASNGTGELPNGELHPDLVNRLAKEASKTAGHILNMCIRALDYCPPVDITFGDFLRGIITADYDVTDSDPYGYRIAFLESFRNRGIFPERMNSMSLEKLRYPNLGISESTSPKYKVLIDFMTDVSFTFQYLNDRREIHDARIVSIIGGSLKHLSRVPRWFRENRFMGFHQRLKQKSADSEAFSSSFMQLTGLIFTGSWDGLVDDGIHIDRNEFPITEIVDIGLVNRVGPDGKKINHFVMTIVQNVGLLIAHKEDKPVIKKLFDHQSYDKYYSKHGTKAFIFRTGVSLFFDLDDYELKYSISKPMLVRSDLAEEPNRTPNLNIKEALSKWEEVNTDRLHRSDFELYFSSGPEDSSMEMFSMLHQH